MPPCPDGVKRVKLSGKWSSHCDAVRCDEAGNPAPGAEPKRLWTCTPKPVNDYYSFTAFAHRLNSSEGIRKPLPSDSRCGREGVGGSAWGCAAPQRTTHIPLYVAKCP